MGWIVAAVALVVTGGGAVAVWATGSPSTTSVGAGSASTAATTTTSATTTATTTTTTTVAPTTTAAPPPVAPEPGGGTTLFPGHRIVAFAGLPGVVGDGVIGSAGPEALAPRLVGAAAQYAQPGVVAVPAYDIVAVVAQRSAVDGSHTQAVPAAVVRGYLASAHAHGGMLVLEVQPGSGSLLAEVQALAPSLADPAVGVAIDPQWEVPPGQTPTGAGSTTAAEIASVAAWLGQFTTSHALPQKLLEVREASPANVTGGPLAPAPPGVALVVGVDAAGDAGTEAAAYSAAAAADPGVPLGYEVSTTAFPSPKVAELLAASPVPSVVEYR